MQLPHDLATASTSGPRVGWLDRWPVLLRMFVATLISLTALGGVTLVSIVMINGERTAAERLTLVTRAQRMLQDAALRRDAVRADVLALLVDPTDDVARVRVARALDEHRRTLIDGVAAVPTGEFKQALTENQPVATAFVDGATNVARLARGDHDAALQALAAFQQSYENLVAANEKVGRLLTTRAAEANARAAYASTVRLRIVGFACLAAFIIVAAVWRVVAVSISRALYRVREAAHAIADGDLSVRSDAPVNDDVGALAGAVNHMADTLQTMIGRLQTEQEQDAFSRQLSEALDMADTEAETFSVVARGMAAISNDMAMELLVADSSRAHLERAISHPSKGAPNCTVESPYGCMAVRRGNPIVFENSDALNTCARLGDRGAGCLSAVCVPLSFMGRSLGVLHATGKAGEPPAAKVVGQLKTLGILSGSRIGTVRAFERTQVQASTDLLTGLLNRRALESRVRRLGTVNPYAVVVADIDHFKRLNDAHGHEAGDRSLKVLADVLRRSARERDHVARWGGEEFVIVLEGGHAADGLEFAERVRANLKAACQAKDIPEITTSFGISDSVMSGEFDQLVRIGDDALYRSKEGGRNRATIGDPRRVGLQVPRRDADTEHLAAIQMENLTEVQG